MHFTSILIPAALLLASGCHAWTKDANGVWVANNTYYTIRGSRVHESCTIMNTETLRPSRTYCAYWRNGIGQKFKGKCQYEGDSFLCVA